MAGGPVDDLFAWAASGAMELTGRRDGPPLVSPGRPAGHLLDALRRLASAARARTGVLPDLPGATILGERAASMGLFRNGPWSCGAGFRLVPALDGHLGLSLSRPADVDLVPALVSHPVDGDPWEAVARWAAGVPASEGVERARLLGLPSAACPSAVAPRPAVVASPGASREVPERPLVVDLTALWAGPLCAHLLHRCGARVVTVESLTRPDPTRETAPAFHALLHRGHQRQVVDLDDPRSVAALGDLLAEADLVLEAARPRALRQHGIVAEDLVSAGTTWLSITAHGRTSDAVGFGDDVAADAGLVVPDGADLLPVGDALADPLTGAVAAAAAAESLLEPRAALLDVSMRAVCAEALGDGSTVPHVVQRIGDDWWVEGEAGRVLVAPPQGRDR